MHRYRLLLIAVLIQYSANSQSDSLKKYSYRIWGSGDSSMAFGTGCFIKNDTNLYLVTAKHVLSGCTSNGKTMLKASSYPGMVMILSNDTSFFGAINLHIKKIKDTSQCLPFLLGPDIICVKVLNSINLFVNSIESFFQTDIDMGGEISIHGFPFANNIKKGRLNFKEPAARLSWGRDEYIINRERTFNNMFKTKKSVSLDSLPGYSGSPVFFKSHGKERWMIAGVFSGYLTQNTGDIFFVIPKIASIASDLKKQ